MGRSGGHHHHHEHESSFTTTRPLLVRLLSVLAIFLPFAMYIISLSATLKTVYSSDFALSSLYFTNLTPVAIPVAPNSSHVHNLTLRASPFYTCGDNLAGGSYEDLINANTTFEQNCVRTPALGGRHYSECLAENPLRYSFCQRSTITQQTYVAGAVLVGLAALLAVVRLAAGSPAALRRTRTYDYEHLAGEKSLGMALGGIAWSFTVLLAVMGVLMLIAAQIVGYWTFVQGQKPSGDDITDVKSDFITQSAWYAGRPLVVFTTLAWVAAAIGAVIDSTNLGVGGF